MNKWKSFKNLLFPMSGGHIDELLRSTFFYSPIVAPGLVILFTGFDDIWDKWINGVVISLVVSYCCIIASALVRYVIEPAVMKALGRPIVEHSKLWGLSLAFCVMPGAMYLGFKVNALIHGEFGKETSIVFDDYRVGFLIGTAIAIGFFVLEAWRESREKNRLTESKMKDMENERLQAQISALTAQMNPHLMFNALNTVASLVPTDPQKAEEVIVKLSELYRGVLNSSRKMTHSLATELGICEAYLAIEKARFGERLQTKIEIEADVDPNTTEIPALCIQPLIENAVKHGLSSKSAGGQVVVSARSENGALKILVQDNGIGFGAAAISPIKKSGAGTGLKNCRERIRLHYGELGTFHVSDRAGGGTNILMTLPMKTVRETVGS